MIRSLIAALVVALAAPAFAQPAERVPPGQQQQVRREEIKKKIRALRAYTLTEELQLDEATAGKLFPLLAKYDDVTDKLLVTRVEVTRRLREVDQLRDRRAVDRLIDEAIANQKAFWDLEDKRLAELRKILTPEQTARILVVLPEFERRIQKQLRRAIAKRGGRRGNPGRTVLALEDDDDDDLEPDELPGPQAPRSGPPKRALSPPSR
jgi:Spy/CpxP family protein refolding chaperone